MKILGIDPGSYNCGYGLIEAIPSSSRGHPGADATSCSVGRCRYRYLGSGRIVLPRTAPLSRRLAELHASLQEVLREFDPGVIVIEKMFFAKGIRAALSLGHTRGVVLLTAAMTGLPIYEYSPLEVKKAVVGYGRADKNQVQKMVANILTISHELSPDGADALALALCYVHNAGFPTGQDACG